MTEQRRNTIMIGIVEIELLGLGIVNGPARVVLPILAMIALLILWWDSRKNPKNL